MPNEREQHTRRIELKMPAGVAPFSFQDLPGWKRTLKLKPDQSIDTIVWTGRLASDGLAEFSFLAATPEREGEIAWKALQTYDDGQIVRWIGDEKAEEPASFTTISADAPRQNAGGEGGDATTGGGNSEPAAATTPATEADNGSDALPAALSGAALAVALAALALVALRTRKTTPDQPETR